MKQIKERLINQAESCIKTLEVYFSGEAVKIITPSIVIDDAHDQKITAEVRGVSYFELEEVDKAFTNYCNGLEFFDYNTLNLRNRYCELRNRSDKIFEERKK